MGINDCEWNSSGYPEKRYMDGIFIRVKRDGKYVNVCLSDATNFEQKEWLEGLSAKVLLEVNIHIAEQIMRVSELLCGATKVEGDNLMLLRIQTRHLIVALKELASSLGVVYKDGRLMIQTRLPVDGGDANDDAMSEVRQ